ncbi:MAG: hypothetical protein ACLSVX_12430 [Massilimicrobiota timonensis]
MKFERRFVYDEFLENRNFQQIIEEIKHDYQKEQIIGYRAKKEDGKLIVTVTFARRIKNGRK